jgi:hypothetical protein
LSDEVTEVRHRAIMVCTPRCQVLRICPTAISTL